MATVTPQMVKELREMTGAGMSDCKKALDQSQGNIDEAVTILRERGLAAAAKKAGRAASEGVVSALINEKNTFGYVVEVNCETDFVTKNDDFQKLVDDTNAAIKKHEPKDLNSLLACPCSISATLNDALPALVAKIGENIQIRRFERLGNGETFVTSYVHGAGKVGVLVELHADNITGALMNPDLIEVGKNVALQVAAMKPQYTHRNEVPAETLKNEQEVFYNQYKNQGKPEAALPKIIASRMETWHKEICLTEQAYVKEDNKNIAQYLAEEGKKLGLTNLTVRKFVRMELGQGVEKKTADFASEVAAQIADATK